MTDPFKSHELDQKDAAVNRVPADSGTGSKSSGYGGKYEGSSKRGEASDWYGETKQKDSPADVKDDDTASTPQKHPR